MGEIPILLSGGRDTLIHLKNMNRIPRDIFVCQRAQHEPGRAATANRHDVAMALRDYSASIRCNESCSRSCG